MFNEIPQTYYFYYHYNLLYPETLPYFNSNFKQLFENKTQIQGQITENRATTDHEDVKELEKRENQDKNAEKTVKIKRKYRVRRTWLKKHFKCFFKGCKKQYSSKAALNCHKQRIHQQIRTRKIKQVKNI